MTTAYHQHITKALRKPDAFLSDLLKKPSGFRIAEHSCEVEWDSRAGKGNPLRENIFFIGLDSLEL
jgi:hypothetical protein